VEIASGERVGFRDACPGCGADLHVCRACAHHDPGAYNGCREPGAERVADPDRANRCEWFQPGSGAEAGADDRRARREGLAKAEALFRR
jgi:hypothetical protein